MNKAVNTVFATLFTLVIFVFLAFNYRGHLQCAEYSGIFLYTWDFLFQSFSHPGGLAKYVIDFIGQFYYIPALGAASLSLLLLLDSLLIAGMCRSRTTMSFILSFLPAVSVMMYISKYGCSHSAILPAAVILGSLCIASILKKSPSWLHFLALPVTYALFGPLSFIYPFALVSGGRRGSFTIAAVSYAICAALSYFMYCPELTSALLGIQSYSAAYADSILWPRILPLIIAISVMCLPSFEEDLSVAVLIPTSVVVLGLLASAIVFFSNSRIERVLRYDSMLRRENWNGILKMSEEQKPTFYEEVCCTDLALAMKGKLADKMFDYPQGGPMALMPAYSNKISPLYSAEALTRLGLFPPAQRFAFEAQTGSSAGESNARCYKLLAELNAALGFEAVAQKYADILAKTLFYRSWANNFDASAKEKCLSDSLKLKTFYYDVNFGPILSDCLRADPDNAIAREYMLCWYILSNDLTSFAANFNPGDYLNVPPVYQQAYALFWAQNNESFEKIPSFVSKETVNDLLDFADLRIKGQDAVKKKYGNTCWYYIFYTSTRIK